MRTLFVINVFRDAHKAKVLLAQLDKHYPECDRLIVEDSPRLKHLPTGEWSHRYLERSLDHLYDVIVKLDPDVNVKRRGKIICASYFGQVNKREGYVYGWACGFSRPSVRLLVESRFLLRETPFYYHRGEETMSCQDQTVGRAMKLLEIRATPWKFQGAITLS